MQTIVRPLLIVLVALAAGAVPARASDPAPNRAGLVVVLGPGEVLTSCVSFAEAQISGTALLERSGLALEAVSDPALGTLVCGIAGVGCPAASCFCAFPPSYWQYWLREDGGWRVAPTGASGRTVAGGAVDGWLWAGAADGAALPDLTFAAICPAASPARLWLPLVARHTDDDGVPAQRPAGPGGQ